jgi:hypothetical protein
MPGHISGVRGAISTGGATTTPGAGATTVPSGLADGSAETAPAGSDAGLR